MKKTLAIILVLVMAVALFAACGSSESTSTSGNTTSASNDGNKTTASIQENAKDTIDVNQEAVEHDRPISVRVALSNSAVKMGPDMIINPYNNILANGVYERLAERAYYGSTDFVGVLLKDWEMYDDDYGIHCELYDYIYDHDGNNMTAEDILWCINMQDEVGNKNQARKVNWDKTKVTGTYTFDLYLTQNYAGFFTEWCEALWFCTQAAFEKAQASNSICAGTGPYKVDEFISNSYLIVEKTNNYWQTEDLTAVTSRANVDVIRYDIVSEVTQMAIAISDNKTFQMAGYVAENLVPDAIAAEGKSGMTVTNIKSAQTKVIGFNCSEYSPCQDVNLRRAICYALNNEMCLVANYSGIGFIPETFGVETLMDWDPSWTEGDYYSYNLDKAKECLKEGGYDPDNAGVDLVYMGNQTTENENNGIWISGCLSELGINVTLNLVESAASNTYRDDPASGWDMFEMGLTPSNLYMYLYVAGYADATQHGGHTAWCDSTEEMQERVKRIQAGDTEEFEALRTEINDNAYLYHFLGRYFVVIHDDNITNIVTDWRNSLAVGACTFSEAYDHYAD